MPTSRQYTLTDRDTDIVAALVEKVRCLSITQIAQHWWPSSRTPEELARQRMRQLVGRGLVDLVQVYARPRIALTAPIVCWQPGQPCPDFGPVSHQLKTRFHGPAVMTTVVVATRRAGELVGRTAGRPPRRPEATHDLGLADVYLLLRRVDRPRALAWVSESRLVEGGEGKWSKLPDAVIRLSGKPEQVVEFGGEYSKSKLNSFHADCVSRARGYELW